MRVLIVDDSAFMRRALSTMLSNEPDIEIVGTGCNGREGLELCRKLKPDVMTLDIEMPEMDGLTALRRIMSECPTRVLMVSSLTTSGSHAALRALSLGAADVLAKDTSQISLSVNDLREELLQKVRALGKSGGVRCALKPAVETKHALELKPRQIDMICIGSSTGGPPVLETVLKSIPSDCNSAIVVAQHMPKLFTQSLAERLDELCNLPVVLLGETKTIERGRIHICPGGAHTHIQKAGIGRWSVKISDEPVDALYKPSADVLLETGAKACGQRCLGIVLTGMGDDGYEGGKKLHEAGGKILAQSAETCVVYGMPKKLTEQGLVAASMSPDQIAKELSKLGTATGSPVTPSDTLKQKTGSTVKTDPARGATRPVSEWRRTDSREANWKKS